MLDIKKYKHIIEVESGFYKRDLPNGTTLWLQVRPFNNYLSIAETGNELTFDNGW